LAASLESAPDLRVSVPLRAWSTGIRVLGGSERASAYRSIALWWAGSRVLVFAAVLAAQALRWPRESWYPSISEHPFALLEAWDGRWYRTVAEHGYLVVPQDQSNIAFFPLYPALVKALGAVGIPHSVGGLLLANVGFLVGLLALYELGRTWLTDADAKRMAIYAALFPFGFVFSMLYPEGVALAAVALAGLLAVRRRWLLAGLAAALATLARPEGVFLALPLAVLAARRWRELSPNERGSALTAVLAAPAALGAFIAYAWTTFGDPLASQTAQRAWGRILSLDGPVRAVEELLSSDAFQGEWLWRDAVFCLVYVVCLGLALRAGVPRGWVVSGALIVLLPLFTGTFTSVSRFGLLALPVYAGLAFAGRRRWLDVSFRLVGGVLLVVGSMTILYRWP